MSARRLNENEKQLIQRMLAGLSEGRDIVASLDSYEVEEMNDGGMGSLRVVAPNKYNRKFGNVLAECELKDEDGVPILVSIFLDSQGKLFELDVWKVDFSARKGPFKLT